MFLNYYFNLKLTVKSSGKMSNSSFLFMILIANIYGTSRFFFIACLLLLINSLLVAIDNLPKRLSFDVMTLI
jgi:hypothetical protein